MTDRTYRVTEIVGTSPDGIEPAIRSGIARAGQTLRHLDWFEVTEVRGQIVSRKIVILRKGKNLLSHLLKELVGRIGARVPDIQSPDRVFVRLAVTFLPPLSMME